MEGNRKVLVIGGGVSGMAAALAASKAGAHVTMLERMDRVGKKLLATGNGRCNLENRNADAGHYTGSSSKLNAVLQNVSPQQVLTWFEELGLLCDTQPDGRVYPYCYQASMVLDVLRLALERQNVSVECGCEVQTVVPQNGGFSVTSQDGRNWQTDRVILAAGGKASPSHGTNGSAFSLARSFGHTVTPLYPCLVPLRCKSEVFPGLKGLRTDNCRAGLYADEKLLKEDTGEVLFTEYGVSGIPVLQLSTALGLAGQRPITLQLDFFPHMEETAVRNLLVQRRKSLADQTLENFLLGLIAKKLAYAVLKSRGCAPLSRKADTLSDAELNSIAAALKGWRFPVVGTQGWDAAQVTGGGVSLQEIDPRTCESLRQRGLYLTGEVLDAAGECGGFNLHWAWCTGLTAGRSSAIK
jgi:predicted Rossmann fold flavoprotein